MIHLHVHTKYSVGDALPSSEEYAKKIGEGGVLAITDHNNMGGIYHHKKACEKHGVKPIYGIEITVEESHNLTLLAMNNKGLNNLFCLMQTEVSLDDVEKYNEGLIALSGDFKSALAQSFLREDFDEFDRYFSFYKDTFEDRFYLEIIHHGLEEQKRYNDYLYTLDHQKVITGDVHYLSEGDHEFQGALLCDKLSKVALDPEVLKSGISEAYMRDLGENPNAKVIADRCNVDISNSETFLPNFVYPDDFDSELGYLKHLVWEGLKERGCTSKEYIERVSHELSVIENMGFVGYFLIVWDFVKFAHDNKIPVGPGRGSGAGSLVAYALKITNLDPLEYNLIFERFLNPERVSMPDFDMDFCQMGRSRVIDYVIDKYGRDCVSAIGTYGELKPRAAWKSSARVLGIPFHRQNFLSDNLPDSVHDKTSLSEIFESDGNLKDKMVKKYSSVAEMSASDEKIRLANKISVGVEGSYKSIGRHAAGVLISDGPISDYIPSWDTSTHLCPIDAEADNIGLISQLDMIDAEYAGLVKFDFLGLKELTVIDYATMLIKEEYGVDIDIDNIPLDDKKVFSLLSEGNTLGVFQIAGQGMTEFVKILKPSSLEDIIATVALYRPGPMDYGGGMHLEYAKRKNGESRVEYLHESLKPILKSTYGIIVYQEQIMQIAREVAGYSLGEADILRRAMGKKKKKEMDSQIGKFFKGMEDNGYEKETIKELWDQVETFSRYGFNRAHAASYGMITYQTAWLKAHYPEELMAAQMQVRSDKVSKVAEFIYNAEKMGIDIEYPSVQAGNKNFITKNKKVYAGLKSIKGIGDNVCNEIEKKGPFKDLCDLFMKVKIGKGDFKTLLHSGAFDSMSGASTLDSLAQFRADFENQFKKFSALNDKIGSNQNELFPVRVDLEYQSCSPMEIAEMLKAEYFYMDLYRTAHPIQFHRKRMNDRGAFTISEFNEMQICGTYEICGVVVDEHEIITKNDEPMCFLTLEDETGRGEVTVFPDSYRPGLFTKGDILCVEVEKDVYNEGFSSHLLKMERLKWNF